MKKLDGKRVAILATDGFEQMCAVTLPRVVFALAATGIGVEAIRRSM